MVRVVRRLHPVAQAVYDSFPVPVAADAKCLGRAEPHTHHDAHRKDDFCDRRRVALSAWYACAPAAVHNGVIRSNITRQQDARLCVQGTKAHPRDPDERHLPFVPVTHEGQGQGEGERRGPRAVGGQLPPQEPSRAGLLGALEEVQREQQGVGGGMQAQRVVPGGGPAHAAIDKSKRTSESGQGAGEEATSLGRHACRHCASTAGETTQVCTVRGAVDGRGARAAVAGGTLTNAAPQFLFLT